MHGFSFERSDKLRIRLDGVDIKSGVFDTVSAKGLIGGGEVRAGEDDAFDIVEVFGRGRSIGRVKVDGVGVGGVCGVERY